MTKRIAVLTGAVVLGVVSGVAAVVLHQAWMMLLLAALAAVATMRWLAPGAGRVGFALGWAVVVLRGALTTPAGDYLVPANALGLTLLVTSLALVLAALATARRRDGADGVRGEQPTPT